MKLRKLANNLLVLLFASVLVGGLLLGSAAPVSAVNLQAAATVTQYTRPLYLCNSRNHNGEVSILQALGVTAYNQYLLALNNEQNLALPTVVVAVIDSGLDTSHEIFTDRVDTEHARNFYLRYDGMPTGLSSADWHSDESGHGTHVAGLIADATIANIQILPVRIFGGSSNYLGTNAFADAVTYVAALRKGEARRLSDGTWCNTAHDRLNIVAANLSLGTEGILVDDTAAVLDNYNSYKGYIQTLRNAGILPIAAAGNIDSQAGESNENAYYSFPAACDGALAVSAYDFYDANKLAAFSYYNDRVSLAAPGVDIWSAGSAIALSLYKPEMRRVDLHGNRYLQLNGTSMATPYVTACYAMLMSDPSRTTAATWGITWTPEDSSFYLNWQHKALLAAAATSADFGEPGKDDYYGYGGVNVSSFATGVTATEENLLNDIVPNETFQNQALNEPEDWGNVVWILLGIVVVIIILNAVKSSVMRRRSGGY